MSLLGLMEHTGSLYRDAAGQGQSGGQKPAAYVIDPDAQDVPCAVQPANASTQLRYMQRRMSVTHTLYFNADWRAKTRDRWVVNGRNFIVRGWYNSCELDDTWVCDAEELPA